VSRAVLREQAIKLLKERCGYNSAAHLINAVLGNRGDESDTGGPDLLLREFEPHEEHVEGDALLDELRAAIRRYLVLGPVADVAIALWTVHAHAHDLSSVSPILVFISPVRRCGKTTALEAVQALTPRPLPVANITAAAMFRVVELYRPTMLIDEADTYFRDSDELRGVVNSGHKRSMAYVVRTVGDDHEPQKFSTWAPKAVALIGRLPGTTEDRSIVIEMRRKTATETVERFRGERSPQDLEESGRKVARWVQDNEEALRSADPEIPGQLHDRAADNWRALLAIADQVGGEWPRLAREAAVALSGNGGENESRAVMALEDLQTLFRVTEETRLFSDEIVEHLKSLEHRPWPEHRQGKPITTRQFASLMGRFRIKSTEVRRGDVHKKGYRLEDCEDTFTRYIPPVDPRQARQDSKQTTYEHIDPRHSKTDVADREADKPPVFNDVADVAAEKGGLEAEDEYAREERLAIQLEESEQRQKPDGNTEVQR
jgi:putative DNA primase/helicase